MLRNQEEIYVFRCIGQLNVKLKQRGGNQIELKQINDDGTIVSE